MMSPMGKLKIDRGWHAGSLLCRALFGLLLVASSLSARDLRGPKPSLSSSREAWNRFQSAHFTIFSDAPEAEARRFVANLERFRSALSTFHSTLVIDPPRPTYLFIFKSEKDFRPYKPRKTFWKLVAGYMNYERDANYIAGEVTKGSDASQIIYHEFVHELLTENLPNAPPLVQ